jgi:hypothetical protein
MEALMVHKRGWQIMQFLRCLVKTGAVATRIESKRNWGRPL